MVISIHGVRKSVRVFVWLLMAVVMGLGCEAHERGSEIKQKNAAMAFMNASNGLPSSGQWRQGIAIADVNKDGHLDIVSTPPRTAAAGDRVPHVWYGDGKGGWTRAAGLRFPEDMAYDYGSIAVGDFDGDGVMDLGLGMHTQQLKVFLGKGEGRFEDASTGLPPGEEFVSRALIAGQFDADPNTDLVALSEGPFRVRPSGMRLCTLSSDGQWSYRQIGDEEMVMELGGDHLAAGDVNGDGFMDIAAGSMNPYKRLIVWINDGKGNFTPFNEGLPEEAVFLSVSLADVDRDGRDDLLAAVSGFGRKGAKGIKVFLSRPEKWEEFSNGLPVEAFFSVSACDLNGDGAIEIVGGTVSGIRVFSMGSTGWEETEVSGLPGEGLERIFGLHCVDVNADGYGDIVVNYAKDEKNQGGIQVFLNQHKGAGKKGH